MDIKNGVNGVLISATLTNTSTTTQSFRVGTGWRSHGLSGGFGTNADYADLAPGASASVVLNTPKDLVTLMLGDGSIVLGPTDITFSIYSWPNGVGGELVFLFTTTVENAFNVVL